MKKEKDHFDHMDNVKDLITQLSTLINNDSKLKDMNFGLFYQHGRLGFVDLDIFAKTTKAKLTEDGEEKTLTEMQKEIDKDNK